MTITDRYVLSTFIKNYLISFMVLIGMYVALDMVFNFANLTQAKPGTADFPVWRIVFDIGDFYFYQGFVFFVHLSGLIAVVAAAFTLMRLSRFNEMTALLAAGTPLFRIAMPIILAGVVLNVILLPIDQELIIPQMIPKLIRDHGDIHEATVKTFPVHMMQDDRGGLFNAALYCPRTESTPATVQYLDVIERDTSLRPISHLYADQATWNDQLRQWELVNGYRVPVEPPQQTVAEKPKPIAQYATTVSPDEIALNLGKDYIQLLSLQKINQLLNLKRYGTIDLLRTKHARVAQWLLNVFLLLLAISTVLTREPSRLKTSVLRCLVLVALCMGCVFVTYQMAATNPYPDAISLNLWPALMAWTPIFIFGPLSIYLLGHVKS